MYFLGRYFGDVSEALLAGGPGLPDDLIVQMAAFWDARVAISAQSDSAKDWSELGSFGLWFASGIFDEIWAIDNLAAIGSRGHKIDRPDLVRRRLRQLFDHHPLRVLGCLESLLASTSASVLFSGRHDEVSEMLEVARSSMSIDVVVAGARLRNRLVASGFLGYADYGAED